VRLHLVAGRKLEKGGRRVKIAMASGCPYAYEFGLAHAFLADAVR